VGEALIALGKIVEIYDYDTVWFKELIQPLVIQASFLDNSFCQPFDNSYDGSISFTLRGLYYRDIRYPKNVVTALSKIGGLAALLKIGIIMSYYHKKLFEKKFIADFEKLNPNLEKLNINQVKK
jgi:hypothetical protein